MAAHINLAPRKTKFYKERRETMPSDFKQLYRFEKENVEWLASYFLENTDENRGGALNPFQKMKTFLR